MNYNYYFEITAMVILSIIVYDSHGKKHKYRLDARLFEYTVLAQLVNSALDILSCVCLEYYMMVPRWGNIFICVLYFAAQCFTVLFLYAFTVSYCTSNYKKMNLWMIPGIILFCFNLYLSIGSIWGEYYFYLDVNDQYHQGAMTNWGYYFYIFNAIAALVVVFHHRKKLLKSEIPIAVVAGSIIAIGAMTQFFRREFLFIGVAMAVALLLLYMSLESPNNYQDKLTGCANDYAFKTIIADKIHKKDIFSVLCIDIEKFRFLNSMYGFAAGDYILRSIGQYLKEVYQKQQIYRISSNTFALIVDDDVDTLKILADKIHQRFEKDWKLEDGQEIHLEACMVACEYPRHFTNHSTLVEMCKYLSKKSKHRLDNKVIYASDNSYRKCHRKEEVEKALQLALRKRQIQVYYQPIYDCDEDKVVSLEALARLYDEKLGWIPPDEFIPVAEETGLIMVLGNQVFELVCKFISNRLLKMGNNNITTIEVNLSPLQCMQKQVIEQLKEIMVLYDVPGNMINFEITESATADEPDLVLSAMNDLIDFGVTFSLDDYGTGYSNISYLIQFPFERIKFDKELVWSYFKDEQACTIMKKEFDLIHLIGKDIVVEGIESKEQCETLSKEDIRYHQGYFFSKPIPEDQCIEYLESL